MCRRRSYSGGNIDGLRPPARGIGDLGLDWRPPDSIPCAERKQAFKGNSWRPREGSGTNGTARRRGSHGFHGFFFFSGFSFVEEGKRKPDGVGRNCVVLLAPGEKIKQRER
jgi:hypothetical protein